jgi:hypothetical protein
MPPPDYPGLDPTQERKLKLAVEGTCELCSGYFPLHDLTIHRISRRQYREMVQDPSTRILVVCNLCHEHIHRLPVPVLRQRSIVSGRSFFVRRDIRRVLGYRPKPYTPPENPGISMMDDEYFYHFPPGSFRLGG